MHCLLVGNYGVGNLGDEALREYFLRAFPEITWTVISANPVAGELPRLPAGFHSLISFRWWKTFKAVKHSEALVLGGGSLLTDTESVLACFLWWLHVMIASLRGCPILLAFQGIGPFRTELGRWFAKDALDRSMFISVRDKESGERVHDLAEYKKIVQSFDPVLSLFEAKKESTNTKNVLTVIPRRNSGETLTHAVLAALTERQWQRAEIISFQSGDPVEKETCNRLRQLFSIPVSIISVRTVQEAQAALEEASLVITERYHGAIVALGMGRETRIVAQAEGDKLAALATLLKEPGALGRLRESVKEGEVALRAALKEVARFE